MNVSDISASTAAAQEAQRTIAVMAKTLKMQREQADATVALIQQAAPAGGDIGRVLDRWA
jgi:hypothetical protein